MTDHRNHTVTLRSLSKRQWLKIAATVAAVGLFIGGGTAFDHYYRSGATKQEEVTAFSATAPKAASRGGAREDLRGADADTTYVTVVINGEKTTVLGSDFTDVKSVLETGDIVLGPDDVVSPALDAKVTESTVITIERAGADVETVDTEIPFNEVRKETASLPKGTEQVQQEGQNGVMEATNLVTRAGDTVVSSSTIASWVKQAPVDKVILVGTGTASSAGHASGAPAPSASVGTTVPVGAMQQWAHDYLIGSGYSEADFTAAVYIINHESGWNPSARNPSSGAYGLPQALPGSKMASAGADWATNYQTQFKWFVGYCNGRYGSIQGAYAHWLAYRSY